ncbi:MAG: hypothetical protein D6690_02455 [Nitrospirae bacterium]|nr:MAG: hypothetical protein D6690_02455 [Nitrospirota bacterium]
MNVVNGSCQKVTRAWRVFRLSLGAAQSKTERRWWQADRIVRMASTRYPQIDVRAVTSFLRLGRWMRDRGPMNPDAGGKTMVPTSRQAFIGSSPQRGYIAHDGQYSRWAHDR